MAVHRTQTIIAVLWPSFLLAVVATGLFFSTFDPYEILAPTWFPELSRMGAYSIGFLLFWLLTAASSLLTLYFTRPIDTSGTDSPPGRG